MNTYYILEENMERLEKKLNRIQKKCEAYGCTFHFERAGEEFRTVKQDDGKEVTAKFIAVQAEGVAQIPGWRFVAQIDHHNEGNIIRQTDFNVEIPDRFYTCGPECEHCKKIRSRKNTCIIQNSETGEFLQVGNTCLIDYTHGFDAEFAAKYISWFDELIQGEVYTGGHLKPYYSKQEIAQIAAEVYRKFGYSNSNSDYPTSRRVKEYRKVLNGGIVDTRSYTDDIKQELDRVEFDASSSEAKELTDAALSWIATKDDDNTYIHNLKIICVMDYIEPNDIGILVSLFQAYSRDIKHQEELLVRQKEIESEGARSNYQGEIGKRIEIDAVSSVITSWDTMYGTTWMYKLIDDDGNIFIWKSSNFISSDTRYHVVATVKSHEEYRGVKQTILTRCRCTEIINKEQPEAPINNDIDILSVFTE